MVPLGNGIPARVDAVRGMEKERKQAGYDQHGWQGDTKVVGALRAANVRRVHHRVCDPVQVAKLLETIRRAIISVTDVRQRISELYRINCLARTNRRLIRESSR